MSDFVVNPFVSEQQRKACYAKQAAGESGSWDCEEWSDATPKGKKLPKRKRPSPTTNARIKLSKKAQQLLARRKAPRPPSVPRPKTDNLDPTRTLTLRRAFLAKLNKRFAVLKGRIVRYVALEDSFDLTTNEQLRDAIGRFAPLAGGLTPFKVGQVVGLTAHHAGLIKDKATEVMDKVPGAKWMRTKVAAINTKLKDRYGAKQAGAIVASGVAISWGVFIGGAVAGVPLYVPTLAAMVPGACLAELHYQLRGKKQRTEPTPTANVVTDGVPSGPKEQLSDIDTIRLAHELLAELEHIWADRPTENSAEPDPELSQERELVRIAESAKQQKESPDYGQLFLKTETQEVWYVSADGDDNMKWLEDELSSAPLVRKVTIEAEGFPPADGTWLQLYPRTKRWVHNDCSFSQEPFTANAGQHAFLSDADKLEAFQRWLDQQLADTLLGKDQEQLWHQFIRQGFGKGAGRSYDDVRTPPTGPSRIRPSSTKGRSRKARTDLQGYIKGYSQDQSTADFYSGTKSEFLNSAFNQPVSQEKLDLLASRAFDEMEGMAGDMANRLSRTLADGLTAGDSPHDVAARMSDELDISRDRAETIASTELIRAHAEGQLLSLENLGVTELGVAVEWSNSGLNTVDKKGRPISPCARCKALSGVVLKLSEAHGLIPFHPRCQCAWLPAGLGEDTSDQLLTKEEIDAAFIEAEADPVPDIDEDRPVSIIGNVADIEYDPSSYITAIDRTAKIVEVFAANTEDIDVLAVNRTIQAEQSLDEVFNAFCPTGPGGGVDPTCPPHKSLQAKKPWDIAHKMGQLGYSTAQTVKVLEKLGHKVTKSTVELHVGRGVKGEKAGKGTPTADEVSHLHDLVSGVHDKPQATSAKQPKQPTEPKVEKQQTQPKQEKVKDAERPTSDRVGRKRDDEPPAKPEKEVATPTVPPASKAADKGRVASPQSSGHGLAELTQQPAAGQRIPATVEEATAKIDRYEKFFRDKGQHEAADWMGSLKDHVSKVGTDEALKSLGQEVKGKGEQVQYAGHSDMQQFAEVYLDRHGISLVEGHVPTGSAKAISTVASSSDTEGVRSRGKAGDVFPKLQGLKDKLDEAKHLPGLEKSEDLSVLMGHGRGSGKIEALTKDVTDKLDKTYGEGKWIVKSYGDEAFAGFGIYFPQRAAAIQQDAKNILHAAEENIGKYGFSHLRDKSGTVVGIKHSGGDEYRFGTKKYEDTINGDVRHWADKAEEAADHERGAHLPRDDNGKTISRFMAQPAFSVVGVSDADRAAGRTHEGTGEGRVHIVTRDGKAEVIPHSTWIKGEHLPVVFESEGTRSMAKAALDAINALPASEKQGQLYAPDVVRTAAGHRVVEANPANEAGASGYLQDNPLIIDSYVSHLTNREPAHVKFIRDVLTKRSPTGNVWAGTDNMEYVELLGNMLDEVFNANPEGHNQYTHAVGAKVEQHGAGVGEVVSVDKNGKTGTVQVGKYTLKKQKLSDWQSHDPETSIYTKGKSTTPKTTTVTQSSLPHDGGKTPDHAKHVEDAVVKHGGQMVSLVKVRKHLDEQGITDRGYQDAAIEHARGGSVTGSNLEGRHGISELEHAAALHTAAGEDRIGYLSLKE